MDAIVESPNAEYSTETREELLYNKGTCFFTFLLHPLADLVVVLGKMASGCRPGVGTECVCVFWRKMREKPKNVVG